LIKSTVTGYQPEGDVVDWVWLANRANSAWHLLLFWTWPAPCLPYQS